MLTTRDIPGVEILSVGTWHGTGCPPKGCEFTTADLDRIVADYTAQGSDFAAPVKLGHDDNQKLLQTDGYPAAGWLSNLRREGEKLLADLLKVPAKIADLMDVGAYRTRSVELEDDRLTGMALLGADLPAVENLSDITAWYKRQHLKLDSKARAVVFSAAPHIDFALPTGMSYDDLSTALRGAFASASPGADADDVWVTDLYEGSAIFCLDGRYWQQSYTVNKSGITVTGMPAEVQRVTEWRSLSKTYADNAEHVLADVQALIARSGELASLRAKDGRSLSKENVERLTALHAGVIKMADDLASIVAKPPDEQPPDYSSVMQARTRLAALRMADLVGAST